MDEKQGRWSAQKKTEVVMRLLRGESIDAVSREHTVTVDMLTRWREDFVAAGTAGLEVQNGICSRRCPSPGLPFRIAVVCLLAIVGNGQ